MLADTDGPDGPVRPVVGRAFQPDPQLADPMPRLKPYHTSAPMASDPLLMTERRIRLASDIRPFEETP